jgi:hypothetical protein
MRSFVVDNKMFEQPGFAGLFEAWSDVFEVNDDGTHKLDPRTAIDRTISARREAMMTTGFDGPTVTTLENIACRYAQAIPVFIEEIINA